MEQHTYKFPTLLPWRKRLGYHTHHILVRVNVRSLPFITCAPLSHKMKPYALRLLFQTRFGHCSVSQYGLVVAKNEIWFFHRNPHRSQLVAQPSNILFSLLHSTKLTPKRTCFAWSLFLRATINRCCIKEDDEPCPWSSCNFVSSMVAIDVDSHSHTVSARFWHIWRKLLH